MEFIYPDITSENKRCVYKLSFEDGSFYIGGTIDLLRRIGGYKAAFKYSIGQVNKLIARKAQQYNTIYFTILEVVPNELNPKELEDVWIRKFAKNNLLLNRSKSAFNNSGMTKRSISAL